MKTTWILAAALALAGCAAQPAISSHADPDAAIADGALYAWRQPPPIADPGLRRQVVEAIDAELVRRGLVRADAADADLQLSVAVESHREPAIEPPPCRPGWQNTLGAPAQDPVSAYPGTPGSSCLVGTLVVDLRDRDGRIAWHASARGEVPPAAERPEAIRTTVARMFATFPRAPLAAPVEP